MKKMYRLWCVATFVVAASFLAGCSSPGSAGGASDPDTGSTPDTALTPDTKPSGCATPADCNDGFACTIDSCASGVCSHTIGPNSGATACPSGEFCLLGKGCMKGKACATTKDCADTDACTTDEFCDPTSSICTYTVLDKDGDGHPPPVCGGDDCDDTDKTRYPGAPELCDGKDNGCDGRVDPDGAICSNPANFCQASKCVCKPENVCPITTGGGETVCADLKSSVTDCGKCGNACPYSLSTKCVAGSCTCDPSDKCGGVCTAMDHDVKNCGACGVKCAPGEFCLGGTCGCPDTYNVATCTAAKTYLCKDPKNCGACGVDCGGLSCVKGLCSCPGTSTACSGSCVSTDTDIRNCGGCGNVCPDGKDCVSGKCSCTGTPTLTCGGTGVDTLCDDANCGGCGIICATGQSCIRGTCR